MNNNIPAPEKEPIVTINYGEKNITILGTAHVSRASADKVRELISSDKYDAVAIELCPNRHHALVNPDALSKMDLFQVIKEKKVPMVAASLALGAYQQRLAEQFDIQPGAEMRMAIECAKEKDLPVLLVDREIGTTLKRVYRNVPWWKRLTIVSGLLASVLTREKVSEEEIEHLKEGDMLETAFSQFATEAKDLYNPLIDERDQYMAAHLQKAIDTNEHSHILAVVGAGHLKGIEQYLKQKVAAPEVLIKKLDELPPAGNFLKWFPWLIVLLILFGFYLGFSRSPEMGWQMVIDWVLINGILAALGSIIAGAHFMTIVIAFLAAPLTSLNPTIGVGMVTAAVETYFRRPQVADFGALRQDTTSLKGWWKNRVTRIFLVFLLSTLGSGIGTYVAGFRIFERLSGS